MNSPALEVRDLTVRLDGRAVLENFSLSAAPGELLVLAGPSGSGKSTLRRAIAGLVPVESGEIRIGGSPVQDLEPGQRDVSMMFQSYALFPHLNVYENLVFGLKARGVGSDEARVRAQAVAGTLGLTQQLPRMPQALSGGERQRVALGRAMLRQPQVFLMDEPLSNLDAQLRVKARAEILKLHRQLGSVTLYVTHDQNEALAIADRLGVLDQGRLVQLGQPQQVYREPAGLFVARFLGSPPMNLLEVRVASARSLDWRGQVLPWPQELPWPAAQSLLLGLRPEHLYLEHSRWTPALPDAPCVTATVDTVEPVGDQQYVLLDAQGVSLTARAEPELPLRAGEAVTLRLDLRQARLFDAAAGA